VLVLVTSLHVYPIKSTGVLDVAAAEVHPWGLRHDRRWMVIGADGANITARTDPVLLSVGAVPDGADGLLLNAAGRASISVQPPNEKVPVPIKFSRLDHAVAVDPVVDDWFSQILSRPARLVWLDDPARREVGTRHGGRHGDVMSLADAGPLLLTTAASLSQLNEWIAETAAERGAPIPKALAMQRFRPNIVIEGAEPAFAEDGWSTVRVGQVGFRIGEHCDRCVLTTIDPKSLDKGKEPIRTLARHRRWDGKVFFGIRLIPTDTGPIRVGDPISFD
jgi:uncharacterized protein YcbX